MVNKDQLDQSPEGHQVLALLAENFTVEQFQPALTLIEQRYTEDQTVWDAELNRESQWPFHRTTDAHRLLIFFASPKHLAAIKTELAQRAADAATQATAETARHAPTPVKPKAKKKLSSHRSAARSVAAKKKTKPKVRQPRRSPPVKVRPKSKSRPVKAGKSRTNVKAKARKKK